ncbi:enoyl-CoA hydratase-related protein [Thiomonas sp.]
MHNAFDEAQIARITQAFEAMGGNPGMRAVVLRARGKHFCAGADVDWMRRAAQASESENVRDAHHFSRMMQAVAV